MRALLVISFIALAACGPPSVETVKDPTQQPEYQQNLSQLQAVNAEARDLFQKGNLDAASEKVLRGQGLANRLLSVAEPSLAVEEAASDVTDLYGRMLLRNRHYGWARLEFQKNRARWKAWKPQTPESQRRFSEAEAAMAECDRLIEAQ